MANIINHFETLLANNDLTVVDHLDLPPREEKREPVPDAFRSGAPAQWLNHTLSGSLWRHQALALDAAAENENVVISTGTASGKTLVFQASAIRKIESDPDARIIVLYPLKALAADQLLSWRNAIRTCGLSENLLATLTGDVTHDERKEALQNARILIATPDVCHAWLMRNLANPLVKEFLVHLSLFVIDEAHVLESIFGSNFAFLFRRLHSAALLCQAKRQQHKPLQVIAASATIANPSEHLTSLTGLKFTVIDENEDGSPHYSRTLLHLASKDSDVAAIVPDLQRQLLDQSDFGSFITFVDSRQRVERLAILTDHPLVQPYRSGYEAEDRARIEDALRKQELRGVVATSALELGINIPHFVIGFNLGLPSSRKAFRQRLGRTGRTGPACFAILAEPQAFAKYGSSLQEYYATSVEPPHLYLDNRFMQFAHAKCLAEELDMMGVLNKPVPPSKIDWPKGFKEVFEFARFGGTKARPREFDHIAKLGGDTPHLNYPLRNIGEENFTVARGHSQVIGYLSIQQAIREAYPGAVYLHMGRRWRVQEWRSTVWERVIRVSEWRSPTFTRPLIRTFVNFNVEREGLVEGHIRKGPYGFLAECQLQITERVEGFEEHGDRKLYKDLRGANPAMTPKTRDFRTTGVVLKIEEDWIKQNGVKKQLADALRDLAVREYSISPQDIGATATNVAMVSDVFRQAVSDTIVVYDATYGSLRLTEPVFKHLDQIINKLEKSSEFTSDDEALVPLEVAENLRTWYIQLGSIDPSVFEIGESSELPEGLIWVYAPGSIVGLPDAQGVLRDIEIIEPELIAIDGPTRLFYRYKAANNGKAMAAADRIQTIGDEYEFVKWNPKTGEYGADEEAIEAELGTAEPTGIEMNEKSDT